MRYKAEEIPVCSDCSLTDSLKNCEKCGIQYCLHYASHTDVRMCANCLADFKVIETIEVKTVERIDESGEVISRKRQIARNLKLEGTDWLFAAAKISTLNDEELDAAIEYHRAIKNSLVDERETRRIEYFKKLHNVSHNLTKIDKQIRDAKLINSIEDGKRTQVKQKAAKKKKDADLNTIAALLGQLAGTTMDPEAVAKMLQAMAAGVGATKK